MAAAKKRSLTHPRFHATTRNHFQHTCTVVIQDDAKHWANRAGYANLDCQWIPVTTPSGAPGQFQTAAPQSDRVLVFGAYLGIKNRSRLVVTLVSGQVLPRLIVNDVKVTGSGNTLLLVSVDQG